MLSNCPIVESQGSGYVILNTAKCLKQLGYEVTLVAPESISLFSFLKSTGIIYRMMLGMAWWVVTHKIKKYDLIIFYGAECFLAVYIMKKIYRIKTPVVLHSNGLELIVSYNYQVNGLLVKHVKRWYHFNISSLFAYGYKIVDKIITVSKSERDLAIHELNINPNKVFYINLGLPDFYFNNKPVSKNKKIITFCGSWIARKGTDAMEKSIPIILEKYKQYTFRIIGAGSGFNVQEHFNGEIVNQIEVIPFVEDKKELMDLYMDSSIFLFPSLSESFGLVIAEAMYCGCALISGPTGFAAELQDGVEAVILPNPDSQSIITAIDRLINDEPFRANIAMNGQLKAATLTWTDFSVKLRHIFEEITG